MAKNFLLKFEVSEQIRSIEWYKFRIRDIERTRWIFLSFDAIFCYSFILNYVFYNSQLLFVEAIIHLRKTICHIPNLRNINDSSHPKYVSEMKKKVFVVHSLCFIHFSLEVYGIRMYRIYTTTNRKRKRAFNTRFFWVLLSMQVWSQVGCVGDSIVV